MKKKKKGIKHHFIPEFYLKYFTDDNGKYFFYHKNTNIFEKNQRIPKSTFFEYDRNKINHFGIDHNAVEKIYCSFENSFAKCMKYILSIKNNIEVMEIKEIIYVLKCFIAIQFCRLPVNDEYFDNFILNYDYKKCRNVFVDNNGKNIFNNNFIELHKNDKDFRRYFKSLILPFLLFHLKKDENIINWQIFNLEKSYPDFSFLCSDSPIIYDNLIDLYSFSGNILLPLTKNKILIYSKNAFPYKFDFLFWESVNMVLFEQSKQYISVLDKKIIKIINDRYKSMEIFKTTSNHRNNIFICL